MPLLKQSTSVFTFPLQVDIASFTTILFHITNNFIIAGNYGEDACKYSPGSNLGAITVGAIDEDDSVSYYSNFGKCVDM